LGSALLVTVAVIADHISNFRARTFHVSWSLDIRRPYGDSPFKMTPVFFTTFTAKETRAAGNQDAPPRGRPAWLLKWKLRRVRLRHVRLFQTTHEHARIYRARAAREAVDSQREFILLQLAESATRRAERLGRMLQKYRVARGLPVETRLRRVIRWFLVRWPLRWTLALLDRTHLRRSWAAHEASRQLRHLCRVIGAGRRRSDQVCTRLSPRHGEDR
jgi:hypothetical protein